MAKFEYASFVFEIEYSEITEMKKTVGLQGLSKENAKVLGRMGEEGWELVSVVAYAMQDMNIAFFKRSTEFSVV